ncbi:hypothetical protein DY138_04925 [Apilactobacillus timberlakei]|uniref:hypothetical protein n=1 Tax=Apilactobacillus timberlakei TaxID=2008380 RepID=UPI00112BE46C|nr:hypothetical protein [Apilactobacillus timberlakei]TPR18960.1 hypothetical protein DY138_04925 [Apilactobacillus timberlakei]TPR20875.1 hypothetical protein DY061_02215 [Apilactobacillus timberlakei]TPR23526.1 hypothetical protein DY083_00085 [Apilactobacillus timberlakei]
MKIKFVHILLAITACLSLITMFNSNVQANAKTHLKPRVELVATYNLKKVSKKTLKQFYKMKRIDHSTNVYVSHGKVHVSMILPGGSPKAPLKKMNFADMPCNNYAPQHKYHYKKHAEQKVQNHNKK